ncbi:MAG TPA: HlyD family type I secretion periplasmic adaptor subunit [Burkholderiales bacterium]|jgi:HlyD family type I secretion membrane fusion protein
MRDIDPGIDVKRVVGAGLAVIALGAGALAAWSFSAPLSGAIIAPGFVKVEMNRQVVQHQEGGIVKEILVRDGQRVRRGETLIVLGDVRVDSSVDLLRTQLDGERAKAARLEAERALLAEPKFPVALDRTNPKVAEILQREASLFRARRDALDSQIAVLRKQIRQSEVEAKALADQIAAEERALRLQKDELAANEALVKQGYVQKTRILALERAVAEYEARWGEHRAELAKTQQRGSELELRILAQRNSYVQNATDELKEATTRIFDLEERLRPSRDQAERQRIAAPFDGEVVGLRVFTAGAVIGPREVLMEVVPQQQALVVEARVRPEDINHVHAGSGADVKLTAFKRRTTPLVAGKLTYVSADRLQEQPGTPPYYLARIEIEERALAEAGDLKLQAGMPAEVYIRTDSRTAVDYLVAPITDYLRRGMREPL